MIFFPPQSRTTTLFYTKISRVSRVRAVTDTGIGDEKRIGEVPTLRFCIRICDTLDVLVLTVNYCLHPQNNKLDPFLVDMGEVHCIIPKYLVVVDQFTPGYQFRPTLNFLEDLLFFIEVYHIIDNHQMVHLHL